jgi:hypothetical protein
LHRTYFPTDSKEAIELNVREKNSLKFERISIKLIMKNNKISPVLLSPIFLINKTEENAWDLYIFSHNVENIR